MADSTEEIKKEIEKLEGQMAQGNFWEDKVNAQAVIKHIGELKDELLGAKKYDKGNCILSILSVFARTVLARGKGYACKKESWGKKTSIIMLVFAI